MGCVVGKETDVYMKNDSDLNNIPVILVLGIPGAGCKTATQELSKLTGYFPIYPRELMKDIEVIKGIKISPDDLTAELIKNEMVKNRDAKGFIIGGFPRTMKMLETYRKMMKMPDKVVLLEVDEDVAKERLHEKFKEIGKSISIEKIVDDAIPMMKKIQKNFDKDSIIKVKSSDNVSMEFYKSLGYASQSIMDMTKIDVQNEIKELSL